MLMAERNEESLTEARARLQGFRDTQLDRAVDAGRA